MVIKPFIILKKLKGALAKKEILNLLLTYILANIYIDLVKMEKQKQQKCCTEDNMKFIGYWYKNYISEFATRIIECKTCKRRFNKSGFENGLTVHSNIIGGTCILKDGREVVNKNGIILNND